MARLANGLTPPAPAATIGRVALLRRRRADPRVSFTELRCGVDRVPPLRRGIQSRVRGTILGRTRGPAPAACRADRGAASGEAGGPTRGPSEPLRARGAAPTGHHPSTSGGLLGLASPPRGGARAAALPRRPRRPAGPWGCRRPRDHRLPRRESTRGDRGRPGGVSRRTGAGALGADHPRAARPLGGLGRRRHPSRAPAPILGPNARRGRVPPPAHAGSIGHPARPGAGAPRSGLAIEPRRRCRIGPRSDGLSNPRPPLSR